MTRLKCIPAVFLAALMVFLPGCASAPQQDRTGMSRNDEAVTAKVNAAIQGDYFLKTARIYVSTFNGVVEPGGSADSRADINRVLELARNVDGVRSIVNHIIVK